VGVGVKDCLSVCKVPLVTALIMVMGLVWWAHLDLRRVDRFHAAEVHQFADGLFHSFKARWTSLEPSIPGDERLVRAALDRLLAEVPQVQVAAISRGDDVLHYCPGLQVIVVSMIVTTIYSSQRSNREVSSPGFRNSVVPARRRVG